MLRHCAIAAGLALACAAPAAAGPPPKPKLIIVISVDQFSADLFAQHRGGFTGGLARLATGAVFGSGYQSHAATETCPGHSTITSGMHPSHTGIAGNTVRDPVTLEPVYCIDDGKTKVPGTGDFRNPSMLKADTLGRWLKKADPTAKVLAVAGKDRAAIPMGGKDNDGEFWWNETLGGFTTYVPDGDSADARLKPVAAFNAALFKAWRQQAPSWKLLDKSCAASSASAPMTATPSTTRCRPQAGHRPPGEPISPPTPRSRAGSAPRPSSIALCSTLPPS